MTPESRATLNELLDNYKNGTWGRQATGDSIVDLFKRNPVNYKRAYSDNETQPTAGDVPPVNPPEQPAGPEANTPAPQQAA